MIKDFDNIKKQLKELSEIINSFKSEAVQLRLIDLIFNSEKLPDKDDLKGIPETIPVPSSKPKKQRTKSAKTEDSPPKKRRSSSGKGGSATITKLAEEGFFASPKTINDIIKHCSTNLALTFKANELSGKLIRMVRNKELKREENPDGTYEYTKI